MAQKIMRKQDDNLYDPEFESAMKYIKDLEDGNPPEFVSMHWKTIDKFLNDINQLVYYVSRIDMKVELNCVRDYIKGLDNPCYQ